VLGVIINERRLVQREREQVTEAGASDVATYAG